MILSALWRTIQSPWCCSFVGIRQLLKQSWVAFHVLDGQVIAVIHATQSVLAFYPSLRLITRGRNVCSSKHGKSVGFENTSITEYVGVVY